MKIDVTYESPWYSAHIKKLCISTQAKTRDKLMENIQQAIELYFEEEKDHAKKQANMKFYLDMSKINHVSHLQRA